MSKGCGACRCAIGLEVEAAPKGLESNDDEDNEAESTSDMQTCRHYLGHEDNPTYTLTSEMRAPPTSVMWKLLTSATRMLHASDVRTRPTSEMRTRPTSAIVLWVAGNSCFHFDFKVLVKPMTRQPSEAWTNRAQQQQHQAVNTKQSPSCLTPSWEH